MEYQFEPMNFQRDFAGLVELSRAVYGSRAVSDEALYQWLFVENIFNPQRTHLFHVARYKGRVIASDGLLPVPLFIAGKEYLAAWSVKTMTHPDYRRRGLFRNLTEYSLQRGKALGIQVVLGFANASSYPGYEKFGWMPLLERQAVLRPLDIKKSLTRRIFLKPVAAIGNTLYQQWDGKRIAALSKQIDSIQTVILPAAPPSVDDLWARMKGDFTVLVGRSYPYLRWRYNQRPGQDYRFVIAYRGKITLAMLVFRITDRGCCLIVDYLGPAKSPALPALLHKTIHHCQGKVRHILCSSGSLFDGHLSQFGFRPLSAPLANNMFIACPLANLDLTPLMGSENWFFSYGDSELDIDIQPQQRTRPCSQ